MPNKIMVVVSARCGASSAGSLERRNTRLIAKSMVRPRNIIGIILHPLDLELCLVV